jgi:aspartyl-tRNA(Asn)/glutamyl-tRNA(Gln) amidotransferase subunit C
MASEINKHELEHLAKLARIELDPAEEEKLLKDLGAILNYFKELQEVDTSAVEPMTGGTDLRNIFREDSEENGGRENTNRGAGVDAFPESQNGYLKIPPVFE